MWPTSPHEKHLSSNLYTCPLSVISFTTLAFESSPTQLTFASTPIESGALSKTAREVHLFPSHLRKNSTEYNCTTALPKEGNVLTVIHLTRSANSSMDSPFVEPLDIIWTLKTVPVHFPRNVKTFIYTITPHLYPSLLEVYQNIP